MVSNGNREPISIEKLLQGTVPFREENEEAKWHGLTDI